MIIRVKHENIDKERWDKIIRTSRKSSIFSFSWYLDACSPRWEAYIYKDYEAIMPLPVNSKMGVEFLYLPFFVRYIDVFGKQTDEIKALFHKQMLQEFRRINLAFQDITEIIGDNNDQHQLAFQRLNLNKPLIDIRATYSKNAKRILKKAQQYELKYELTPAYEWVLEGFRDSKSQFIDTLDDKAHDKLKALVENSIKHKSGFVISVFDGKVKLAGACFLESNKTITYLASHQTELGRTAGAIYHLIDYIIEQYCGRHEVLDFGGSKVASVAQFYKKFGASDAFYLLLEKDQSPFYHKWLRQVRSKISLF